MSHVRFFGGTLAVLISALVLAGALADSAALGEPSNVKFMLRRRKKINGILC